MKVLQINVTLNTGSTGRIAEEIGQTLMQDGYKSYVASAKLGANGTSSEHIPIGNAFEIYMHGMKSRLLDRHGFGSTGATKRLIKQIKKIDPDVIGLHNLHGYYLNVEVLFTYLKRVQKPVIWTFHDCWPFTGHCSYFDFAECEKWKTECCECPLTDKYPASWLVDNSRENFYQKKELFNGLENLTIVTPCHWLKKLVEQSFLSAYPVEVIRYGINLDLFEPVNADKLKSEYNLSGKHIVLGVASVWDRRKGFDYFNELSKRLDDSFRIILIGLPEDKIRALPENIIGIPKTENIDELAAFYSAADVFVNPTLADNFPVTNLEALACGTPVVTFNSGGSPEAIDEETGIVVDKKDVEQLNQAVNQIIKFPSNGYRKKCRERAVQYFNKVDRYKQYQDMFEKMIDKRRVSQI